MQNDVKLIDFLRDRHSTPVAQFKEPGPSREELEAILTLATRVPDHGKLAPWRVIVYRGDVRSRLGEQFLALSLKKMPEMTDAARRRNWRASPARRWSSP